jgi:hypothetical protein
MADLANRIFAVAQALPDFYHMKRGDERNEVYKRWGRQNRRCMPLAYPD